MCDIDSETLIFPRNIQVAQLLALCDQETPQMDARKGTVEEKRRGRKRSLLTFSEITDAFVENSVKSGKAAWQLAKSRKLAGDDTLFNTLHEKAEGLKDVV